MPSRTPRIHHQDAFADAAFRRHFEEAEARNLARRLPGPPPAPAPEPRHCRKSFDTRTNWRPESLFSRSCS